MFPNNRQKKAKTFPENAPMIDVIIPTFNRAAVLPRALESVLKQTYPHFHLTVVDDGSTDETPHILAPYADHPHISLLVQDNKGVSAARNKGILHSKAPWISFLDSDDEWLPHKLERQVDHLLNHPACAFLHSEEIWMRKGVRVNPKKKHSKEGPDLFLRSLDFCIISPSTVVMRRELCQAKNYFDETFLVCEDYDLWLKILVDQPSDFIAEALVIKHGGRSDQLSTQFSGLDYWRIKSLINLLNSSSLEGEREKSVRAAILKKGRIFLQGCQKHNNQQAFLEINSLINKISDALPAQNAVSWKHVEKSEVQKES